LKRKVARVPANLATKVVLTALKAANVPAGTWPQLLWLVDPNDYLKPLLFEVKDE
jgi:hypothetical protein